MKKAVIFDLDGTLWDSSADVIRIWNRVFSEKPETADCRLTQDDMARIMGKTMEQIGTLLFPRLDAAARKRLMDRCADEEITYFRAHGARLYPGLRETVAVLKKDRELFIVSNSQDGYVDAFLTAHGFRDDFRDIEMSGRTGLGKGENIRLLMRRNGVESAVYVGDTVGDEAAAREAGILFVFAAYGFGRAEHPDAVIRELSELPEVLGRMKL